MGNKVGIKVRLTHEETEQLQLLKTWGSPLNLDYLTKESSHFEITKTEELVYVSEEDYGASKSEVITYQMLLMRWKLGEYAPKAKTMKSDGGGGKNYYDLPENPVQLIDLIEHCNMNGNIKDVFKACYRLGRKEGAEEEYDVRKMVFYSLRELGRVTGRKDYLVLAEEVIGHHDLTGAKVIQEIEDERTN